MKTWNSFHPRQLMQGFVEAGILASLFFVAVSGYATTLYWDANGSTIGSGNAGGDWNTNAFWTADSTGASGTALYASLASATNDIYFSAGTDGVGTFTVMVQNVLAANAVNKITVEEGTVTLQGQTSGRVIALTGTGELHVAYGATLISQVQMTGTVGFTKTGAGTLQKTGNADSYTGTTWIKEGTYSGGNNLIPDSSRLLIDAGATAQFWNRSDTVGSLAGAGSFSFAGSAGSTFTCGADNTDTEFSGKISDVASTKGGLVKAGTGTLTLSGANTYQPQTTVTGGVLRITGTHTNGGNYLITSGATLGGTGRITLATTTNNVRLIGTDAANRAKLAPGVAGVGTLTVANGSGGTNVVFGAYSELKIALTGDTVTKLACGAMDLGGTTDYLTINVSGTRTRSRYVFATYTGSLAGNIFDQVTVTGVQNSRIDYSIPGEIAIIVVRGTLISIL